MASLRRFAAWTCLLAVAGCTLPSPEPTPSAKPRPAITYAELAERAERTLVDRYYDGAGHWNNCVPSICGSGNMDWGSDSLTYALWLRWKRTADPKLRQVLAELQATAVTYRPGYATWSDVPMWDSVADVRFYEATGDRSALDKAAAAFEMVAKHSKPRYAFGACPDIDYQQLDGGANRLKTLETDANFIKAALLLHQHTGDPAYLTEAEAKYAAVRRHFLDADVPLYSVYVFDDGKSCQQLHGRYFGSVNGLMIWTGIRLAQATGEASYREEAVATGRAVQTQLSDATGVYAALQAENDVNEPLVEAMYDLATIERQDFARAWLLAAADAAASSVAPGSGYPRNGIGPPTDAPVTAWQTNGGMALHFAAAALDSQGGPEKVGYWGDARLVSDDRVLGDQPLSFGFTGRAVAIIGTLGDKCCESGHAKVFLDGRQTFDRTGIWQNKSSAGRSLPDTVLFAWRWPDPGSHTVEIQPGVPNGKEGGSYFHMTGYYVLA